MARVKNVFLGQNFPFNTRWVRNDHHEVSFYQTWLFLVAQTNQFILFTLQFSVWEPICPFWFSVLCDQNLLFSLINLTLKQKYTILKDKVFRVIVNKNRGSVEKTFLKAAKMYINKIWGKSIIITISINGYIRHGRIIEWRWENVIKASVEFFLLVEISC